MVCLLMRIGHYPSEMIHSCGLLRMRSAFILPKGLKPRVYILIENLVFMLAWLLMVRYGTNMIVRVILMKILLFCGVNARTTQVAHMPFTLMLPDILSKN